MKKLFATATGLGTTVLMAGQVIAADDNFGCPSGDFSTLCNSANPSATLSSILTAVLIVVVLIALVFLIWGGLKWIMSGGDKSKVETARNTIIGAIVGLIIAFLAFFIINFVGSIFGVTLIGGSQDGNIIPSIF